MQIRLAQPGDHNAVRDFYYGLIDAMGDAAFKPGWKKDIYPTQAFLMDSIQNGELYLGEAEGQILACMVVNRACNEGYQKVTWSVEAGEGERLFIHALGVHPRFFGQGIAGQMVRRVMDLAREGGMKTIRLDVLEGNLPAERAYVKLGFQYRGTVQMFYEDTGWTGYKLFEYIL